MKRIFSVLFSLLLTLVFSQKNDSIQATQKITNSNLIIKQDPLIDSLITIKKESNRQKILNSQKTTTNQITCHPYPKNGLVPGYKIQLDRFKTKSEADAKASQFSKTYPGIHASVRYETPNYKVYVGNYFTQKKMTSDLRKIRKTFRGAFSVQSKVYVDKDDWNKKYCPKKSTTTSTTVKKDSIKR